MSDASAELPAPGSAVAEVFSGWAAILAPSDIPEQVRKTLARSVLDVGGLMVAARTTDYVAAVVAAAEGAGSSTAIGHNTAFTAADAATIGGTAAHGEDFDDTFEGTPVHVGAAVIPAVLAAAEAHGASGESVLKGLAVGAELACRLGVVAPTSIHRAGFHPTAVCGAMGAAAGVAATLGLDAPRIANTLGIAGSLASGIIEYLAEGTSTKRLHPGWAAAAGIKAARLASAGFTGPRTVFEGVHGFFQAFTVPEIPRDFGCITRDLGRNWNAGRLAYKPYACGTMVQPFIDCAIKLRRDGIKFSDIKDIEADVGEGTVHRLWEPVGEKVRPTTAYSAKFSGAYGIAVGFVDGAAGLGQYTEERIHDADVLAVAGKIRYWINPNNEYPKNYTGALKVTLADGRVVNSSQPHLRGGVHQPLDDAEIEAKFHANAAFGGWSKADSQAFQSYVVKLFEAPDLKGFAAFRK